MSKIFEHFACIVELPVQQEPIELKKRLEEVRLLESRRSARLADQERDTDFARLADMGGDRRRTTSHSIEVPLSLTPQHNSRKRPPQSYTPESLNPGDRAEMDECNAALILMNLSNSPTSPKNAEKWLGTSPGSSSASWSSGSSSPPLSDDGHAINTSVILNDASARIRTTSVSTSDEGIVVDFKEEAPRKKKANKSRFKCTWKGCHFIERTTVKIEKHIRNVHLGNKKARRSADSDGSFSENDHEEEFYYTEIEDNDEEEKVPSPTSPPTLSHRDMARPPHEDPEYQRQIVGTFKQGRAANCQQQPHHNVGKAIYNGNTYMTNSQHQQMHSNIMPTSPLAHHNYTWPSPTAIVAESAAGGAATTISAHSKHQQQVQSQHSPATFAKHARASPRPSQSTAPYPSPTYVQHHHHMHHNYSSNTNANANANGSNSSSIIHSNNSANHVLHQLSQQNVTVTAHHSNCTNNSNSSNSNSSSSSNHHHQQPQQQQQQLSTVTITPNYHHSNSQQQQQHQQHIRGHQQSSTSATTASNYVALQQHSQTSPPHIQQQPSSQQHVAVHHAVATAKHTPNSPNRRTRGENKKCRKVYGMERRDQWCTQCRWKKACSRFGD